MVAVKSFEDKSSEVIANWFSHPSDNPNSSAGNLGVWKLMLRLIVGLADGFLE